ncbi:MAG: hypothetical protein ACRDI2_13275 [Chloroflexota bacterium]
MAVRFDRPGRPNLRGTLLVALSFLLALVATGVLLVVPVYTGVQATVRSGPPENYQVTTQMRATLLEINGPHILRILALPIIFAGLPLAVNWTELTLAGRAVSAVLLVVFATVTGFSIGLFYVPSAVAMLAAALRATAPGSPRMAR